MAALRTEEIKSAKIFKKAVVSILMVWQKYFFSNRKKAFYTLLSLVLSGVLVFVVFSVVSAIDIKELVRQPYYENSSIYLKLNSTAAENATLELMKDSPFTEELKAQIENISGVTEIYPSKN